MTSMDESNKIPLVCLASRKGGVGKSTLALAIARALALDHAKRTRHLEDDEKRFKVESKRRVVIIDADLLGTEMADMFGPRRKGEQPPGGRWALGLLDLLTQSTGGNTHFQAWLSTWLEDNAPDELLRLHRLPRVSLGSAGDAVLLPTLRDLPGRGRRQRRGGLAERLLSDDFGTAQLGRRLAIVLGCLVDKWRPAAIVIDNSPFHVSLGRVLLDVLTRPPKGLSSPIPKNLENLKCHHLEISAPEPAEVATLEELADKIDGTKVGRGLVFNQSLVAPSSAREVWKESRLFDLAFQLPEPESRESPDNSATGMPEGDQEIPPEAELGVADPEADVKRPPKAEWKTHSSPPPALLSRRVAHVPVVEGVRFVLHLSETAPALWHSLAEKQNAAFDELAGNVVQVLAGDSFEEQSWPVFLAGLHEDSP